MRRVLSDALDEGLLRGLFAELVAAAREQRFEVAPNPCVGAAVLAGGEVVGRGVHGYWGGPHAEVEALRAARASGVPPESWDTLVVTLEPCSSHGKTPPCVDAILDAGLERVVVGSLDPDPRHAGRGLELLAERGVQVEVCEWAAPLRDSSPHFLDWVGLERRRRPRPWTIAKWAQTRTGHLVPPPDVGDGRWISGAESRAEVQVLRGRVDAVVTGVGTVLSDDPRLTVREPGDRDRAPARIVLDSKLRTPPAARLFDKDGPDESGGPPIVLGAAGAATSRFQALAERGAEVVMLKPDWHGRLSLDRVSEWLWAQGFRRVLVEAGPRLLDAFFAGGYVDQVRAYTGEVRGGRGPLLAHRPGESGLREIRHRESGADAVLEGFVRHTP